MKIKINRSILWTESFVNELVSAGIKYVCISPGSRNTPLTLAFARNKKIRSYILVDERSCAFFALGLAKSSNTPVVLVCTSGTATAEFYPAIIEAYQQRVPLIVCTADRPPELQGVGANQTINQNNLYKNHICWFVDVGLPQPSLKGIRHIKAIAQRGVFESFVKSKGPVHLNFPFRKPFEPESYTDEINNDLLEFSKNFSFKQQFALNGKDSKNIKNQKWFREIAGMIIKSKRILIIAGPENYNSAFPANVMNLAKELCCPIIADGCSNIRFGSHDKDYIISNFDAFLRSESFTRKLKPDLILHFGRTITSKALDTFLENCNTARYMINDSGDWFDPSNKALGAFDCKPFLFCEKMTEFLEKKKLTKKFFPGKRDAESWLDRFLNADKISQKIKSSVIEKSKPLNETRIISEILKLIPSGSQIMLSNSLPVRDFDSFAQCSGKQITVFNNRGASGIDGIISTALGIKTGCNKPTVLITGDLAFYYDINGLLAAKKYSLPLIIILVNNNGGGIFHILPISNYGKVFNDFFTTPHNLDFSHFVRAFGGNYKKVKSWSGFRTVFKNSFKGKNFSVIEIQTKAAQSLKLRKKFWNEVSKKLK